MGFCKMLKNLSKSILLILSISILSGCEGLPDNLVEEVERMEGKQERLERFIAQRKNELSELSKHNDSEFLMHYSQSEDWTQYFSIASAQLDKARNLYNNEITPFYDKDDPKDSTSVFKLNKMHSEYMKNSNISTRYVNELSLIHI